MTTDLSTLPHNVRRWLEKAISPQAPIPSKILNEQAGEMDIRGNWMPFTARTCTQARPFTFVWKARFRVLPGVWLVAEDGHDSAKGWGGAKLWGFIPLGGRTGPEVLTMQLVRSLAELPWTPQLALVLPELVWTDTGDMTFQVRAEFGGQAVTVQFELNEDDEIIRACGKRHYDVPDGFVEADWRYTFSDYQTYGAVHIPASAVASYDRDDGVWEYWRGRILSVVTQD